MLILLVASIPVALPAVMSVTMAIGAYALSRQKAILSRLSAIEELAGVDVLCSDKTGTLTLNQLTVDAPIPFGTRKPDDVLLGAALATQTSSDDAIDLAVLHALQGRRSRSRSYKQTAFVPFDPVNKRTVATVTDAAGQDPPLRQGRAAGDRGAGQARRRLTLARLSRRPSPNSPATAIARWRRAVGRRQDLAARRPDLAEDPPRADAKATIAETEKLGLNVKMVTGDDVAIGDQIAKQLGMGDHLLVASDVFKDGTEPGAVIPPTSPTRSSAPTASAGCSRSTNTRSSRACSSAAISSR